MLKLGSKHGICTVLIIHEPKYHRRWSGKACLCSPSSATLVFLNKETNSLILWKVKARLQTIFFLYIKLSRRLHNKDGQCKENLPNVMYGEGQHAQPCPWIWRGCFHDSYLVTQVMEQFSSKEYLAILRTEVQRLSLYFNYNIYLRCL